MTRPSRLTAALVGGLALLAVACGGDDGGSADTTFAAEGAFPATVEAANGEVTVTARPERIVSLSPTATEMLFAVGAGDQVVAVDDQSDYPADAPTTDLSGFEPNVEALLSYDPDLVVMDAENEDIATALAAIDVPYLVQPAAVTFDDVYDQLEEAGTLTGHGPEGAAVAQEVEDQIDELVAEVPDEAAGATYYHELDDTLYSVTSATFIGEVYGLAGLENIADEADDGSRYPQLSAEYILAADPDYVFLADTVCCGQSPETVAERPGWDALTAVQQDQVVPLDDDIASRWGPRVVDFLAAVVAALNA